MPGLWFAGLEFFAVNCWILGIVVKDIGNASGLGNVGQVGQKVGSIRDGKGRSKNVDVK